MADESLNTLATAATAARWVSAEAIANPSTTLTGSLCGCPKLTGLASVTIDSPSAMTSGPGLACARASPGAMTT